jgi:hypothetical protein
LSRSLLSLLLPMSPQSDIDDLATRYSETIRHKVSLHY